MPAPFRFDRSWRFDVPVDELWQALSDTAAYPRWWSWLDRYEAGPLEAGTTARFRVRPPLPYTLSFAVTIEDVVVGAHVVTTVDGDVAGPARLDLAAGDDGGSEARLTWELVVQDPRLRRIERFARPGMLWGHDLVVGLGVRQFRRRALRR